MVEDSTERSDMTFEKINREGDPLDFNQRKANGEDELKLYKAIIYSTLGPGDDRLQVLPLVLEGINESEMKNLPRYPSWVKGQVVTGKSIKKDGKDKADRVWIVASSDFQVGYVIGKCNAFGENTSEKWPYSYNYREIKDFLYGRQCLPKDFTIENYDRWDVVKMVMTDEGGMIEICNNRNGEWALINTSGSMITIQQQKIYIRTGSPPNPPSSGPAGFSAITMTPDKILIKCSNFELDSKKTILGHNNLMITGTPSEPFILGTNGNMAIAIPEITV